MSNLKKRILPFSLTGFIIILDQITKAFIVRNWPQTGYLIKDVFGNDFLWIYHVRNKAIAFSFGENFPEFLQFITFIIVPILVLIFLLLYYFKSNEFSMVQRWAAASIVGGGIGNIIDRIFRPDGVVDFISVRIFGLFGMERWPTFNFADASVVIGCVMMFVTLFFAKTYATLSSEEIPPSEEKLPSDGSLPSEQMLGPDEKITIKETTDE
jgi:signal peptidase II